MIVRELKIIRFLFPLLLFFLLNHSLSASDYYWLKTSTRNWEKSGRVDFLEGKLTNTVLDSLDRIYSKSPNAYNFFFNGKVLQCIVGCSFDLYSIQNDSLSLNYNLFNRGYNCGGHPIVKDHRNYLFGGVGFWSQHTDLLVFDEFLGSWEFVKTTNQPIDYFSFGVYQNSNGIFSIFGGYYNPRTNKEEIEPHGYFLDWENKLWKRIEIKIEGVDNSELNNTNLIKYLETENYLYLVFTNVDKNNLGWNIIEKESGKIYFYDYLKNEDVFLSPFIEVIGDSVNYQSPDGSPNALDIAYLKTQSKVVGEVIILDEHPVRKFPLKDFLYITIIVLLVLFIAIKIRIKKSDDVTLNSIKENSDYEVLIQLLINHSGELLDTASLDKILKIDDLRNIDSKRLKRSRMISKLNELYLDKCGKELIIRDKNPEDKRYVYYKIDA